MLIRIPVAALVGGFLWFLETLLTYYADLFSIIFAGVFGVLVSGIVASIIAFAFLPVLLTQAWGVWRKLYWMPCLIFVGGVGSAIIARLPHMLHQGIDPKFGTSTVYIANPWFGIAAWFALIMSVVLMPIGISANKKWF